MKERLLMLRSRSGMASSAALLLNLLLIRHFAALARQGGKGGKRSKEKTVEPRVDRAFMLRMARLLRIMIPSPFSAEAGMLAAVAGLLTARTLADLLMLGITTSIERSIVSRDPAGFWRALRNFAKCMIPVSCATGLLKTAQAELSLLLRQRLAGHATDRLMSGFTYYGVSQLDGRLKNVDQAVTQDLALFAESVAELYSDLFKPLIDICIYVQRLSARVDATAPAAMSAYLLLVGALLTRLRRPTALYTARVQQEEGAYRFVTSRVMTNAEEIAFFDAAEKEKGILTAAFSRLVAVIRRAQYFRFSMASFDNIMAKYAASVVAWVVVSRPFLDLKSANYASYTPSQLYQDFHTSGKMMINLSAALGRLVLSGRELTRLSGFSARVIALLDVIEDVQRGVYARTKVTAQSLSQPESAGAAEAAAAEEVVGGEAADRQARQAVSPLGNVRGVRRRRAGTGGGPAANATASRSPERALEADPNPFVSGTPTRKVADGPGKVRAAAEPAAATIAREAGVVIEQDDVIEMDNVPLLTPTGDVLIRALSFRVERGMNVLVAGPNGSGKSSLFRVLGGLWPLSGGTVRRPAREQLFYVPQKPYMTLGTLRDQIIYPWDTATMGAKGITEQALEQTLALVGLEYLARREDDGWDAVCVWDDVLSGGEKQRLAMARLFVHSPQFAILDECTSAVSVDVEGQLYRVARERGISLFTVSHRKSLWRWHEWLLLFDGRGGYEYKRIADHQEDAFGS